MLPEKAQDDEIAEAEYLVLPQSAEMCIRDSLTSEIVKGDTILVQAGDKVPTDGVLFEGHIKVSQAAFCLLYTSKKFVHT